MDSTTFLTFAGLGLFFFLMSSGSEIPAMIREYLRQQHIEQIIAQLPPEQRKEFVQRYLDEQCGIPSKAVGPEPGRPVQ